MYTNGSCVSITTFRALYDTLVMSNGSSPIQALKALRSGGEGEKAKILDCRHFYKTNTI